MRKLLGILFCAILAAFAYIIAFLPFAPFSIHQHNMIIHPLEPMVLAIVIGIICGNVFSVKEIMLHNRIYKGLSVQRFYGLNSHQAPILRQSHSYH